MELKIFNKEVNNIWKKAAGLSAAEELSFDHHLYKKLLGFFQVGDYYLYFFNVPLADWEIISPQMETILGYQPSEFRLNKFLEKIHPEDRPYFLNFENKSREFLALLPVEKLKKYKRRYDYRIQKPNGEYIRILQQTIVIEHDDKGGIIKTLGAHTDITHLKPEGKPVFSIIGLDGEPSYIDIDVEKLFAVSKETLSKREKQVLSLLIEGKSSKEIGNILNISKETVDKYRKNMIAKNRLNNTVELVSTAIKRGWL